MHSAKTPVVVDPFERPSLKHRFQSIHFIGNKRFFLRTTATFTPPKLATRRCFPLEPQPIFVKEALEHLRCRKNKKSLRWLHQQRLNFQPMRATAATGHPPRDAVDGVVPDTATGRMKTTGTLRRQAFGKNYGKTAFLNYEKSMIYENKDDCSPLEGWSCKSIQLIRLQKASHS